jgi:hypothetical protein
MEHAVSRKPTTTVPDVMNTIAGAILRSPLYGLLGHNTFLLSFQGRKSGKTYAIPLHYTREGDVLLCFTRRENTWWKNLRGGAPVTVDLDGRRMQGSALVSVDDLGVIEQNLSTFLWHLPGDAPYKGVRLMADGTPHPGDIARSARSAVLVRISLAV